jgi:hypothetical protein
VRALAFALVILVARHAWADDAKPPPPLTPAPELQPLSPLQSPEASLSPLHFRETDMVRVERRARWKRNIGIGLAVPGVILVVLGTVLVGAGIKNTTSSTPHLVTGGAEIAAGAVGGAVGVLLTIPGAVLWVKGQDDLDVAAWRRRRMDVDPTK